MKTGIDDITERLINGEPLASVAKDYYMPPWKVVYIFETGTLPPETPRRGEMTVWSLNGVPCSARNAAIRWLLRWKPDAVGDRFEVKDKMRLNTAIHLLTRRIEKVSLEEALEIEPGKCVFDNYVRPEDRAAYHARLERRRKARIRRRKRVARQVVETWKHEASPWWIVTAGLSRVI